MADHAKNAITKFTVSYVASNDAAQIAFRANETFPTGGQLTVLGGMSTSSGSTLSGSALFAIDKIYRRDPARVRAWVARAIDMLAAGAVTPIVGATLPLGKVAEAHRLLETGEIVGKVLLDCR